MRVFLGISAVALLGLSALPTVGQAPSRRGQEVLQAKCLSCHGDAKLGGLDLRLPLTSAKRERLMRVISGADKLQMPPGKRLSAEAARSDVFVRTPLQFAYAAHAVSLPDFGLPQTVEAFDGVLHSMLQRRHEHRDHRELQAQAADAAHGMGKLMCALKHRVVIELRIVWQSIAFPTPAQAQNCVLGTPVLKRPGIGERPMQALGCKQVDQRTLGDHRSIQFP